jgi:DNA-binding NarL/FixJ family response regulator
MTMQAITSKTPIGDPKVASLPGRRSFKPSRVAPSPIRVVIVDDHTLVRQGIRFFLESDGEIQIVGEADNGETALAIVRDQQPHVVLMDVTMPGVNGIEATSAIRREMPTTEVIALSIAVDADFVGAMIKAGRSGISRKTPSPPICVARSVAPRSVRSSWLPTPRP